MCHVQPRPWKIKNDFQAFPEIILGRSMETAESYYKVKYWPPRANIMRNFCSKDSNW